MIKLEHVSFKYDEELIIDDFNIDIQKNKITFIVGVNGSGKSTLAYLISGLMNPNSGVIKIDDMVLDKKTSDKEIRKKVGIVFQNPSNQILFTSIYEDMEFMLENMGIDKNLRKDIIIDSLKKVGLEDFDKNPYHLSGGEKQRLAIASQLSLNPSYLILDEATSMIDINGKNELYKLMQELSKNMGIICITNNMNELIYADDIIIIDGRKEYKYSIEEILKDNKILTKHNLDIPFLFKLAKKLKIKDKVNLNEKKLLGMIK